MDAEARWTVRRKLSNAEMGGEGSLTGDPVLIGGTWGHLVLSLPTIILGFFFLFCPSVNERISLT